MVNEGIGGQEAPIKLQQLRYRCHRREARSGDLAGRNKCSLAKPDLKPPPPSFDETTRPSAMDLSSCATKRGPT